jgi:uncharacterized membrane protein YgcG
MADSAAAVRTAIDLVQMPSRARSIRQSPLPDGMPLLLRIAALDAEATQEAAALTGRTADVVAKAAAFFVEQILLAPDADSYRVLGATSLTASSELRRNMALLMRWLHPDVAKGHDRTSYVGRVTYAWDDLKTPERRAAYDQVLRNDPKRHSGSGSAAKVNTGRKFFKSRNSASQAGAHVSSKTGTHGGSKSSGGGRSTDRTLSVLQPQRVSLFRRALLMLFSRRRS